jgi:hypothetical protein
VQGRGPAEELKGDSINTKIIIIISIQNLFGGQLRESEGLRLICLASNALGIDFHGASHINNINNARTGGETTERGMVSQRPMLV